MELNEAKVNEAKKIISLWFSTKCKNLNLNDIAWNLYTIFKKSWLAKEQSKIRKLRKCDQNSKINNADNQFQKLTH